MNSFSFYIFCDVVFRYCHKVICRGLWFFPLIIPLYSRSNQHKIDVPLGDIWFYFLCQSWMILILFLQSSPSLNTTQSPMYRETDGSSVRSRFHVKHSPCKWKLCQKDSISRVIQNGYLSEPIILQRGCRQGDPCPLISSHFVRRSCLRL